MEQTMRDGVNLLMDIAERGLKERLARSFCVVSREERQARVQTIIELSVELERIRKESIFATRLAQGVIEDVIEGDWTGALQLGFHFLFEEEIDQLRVAEAPRWAGFVEIIRVAAALAQKRAQGATEPD